MPGDDMKRRVMHQSPRKPSRATRPGDDGVVLPLVLVLTIILAVVVVAIADHAVASLRRGTIVQDRTEALAAADGGARIALEKLRTRAATCTDSTPIHTGTINGQGVTVTCERLTLLQSEVGQFALVVTGENVAAGSSSFVTGGAGGPNSDNRMIGGNVYFAEPPTSFAKPTEIKDGDLWYYAPPSSGCNPPNYSNLSFDPPGERGYICTQSPWQDWFPQPALPTIPTVARGALGTRDAQGCTIFQPGVYSTAPVIDRGSENFFRPGTYYFTFSGPMDIQNADVFGGVSGTDGSGSSASANTPTSYTPVKCASAMAAAAAGSAPNTGVTWVFSGTSRFFVDALGHVELFAPPKVAATDIMSPSIVALQTATSGYAAHAASTDSTPLIDIKEGSNNGLVVHGGVWAPAGTVIVGNAALTANGQFLGTVLTGKIDMQAAGSAVGLNISVPRTATVTKVVLTSRSLNTEVRVVALVRSSTGQMSINSWRVE